MCAGSGKEDDEPVRAQAARHDGEEDVGQGAASRHHQHRRPKHGVVMTSHGWTPERTLLCENLTCAENDQVRFINLSKERTVVTSTSECVSLTGILPLRTRG